ncbi:hypothetical protein H0H81_001340 [Sphagnurus paluster]|uniref:EKC/KEOPS complex subunit CGI121 n=1 Tax=Sphagnurus paluster TaxID=117069 RepID=A0A9P7KHZ8_9AGAR|nr:hypothetical protein H0H81_001340 [Sphagnurus paluster]
MEIFNIPQFTPERRIVHAALYTNVTNGGVLRQRIIAAANATGAVGEDEREAVNFAFIDARLITSRLHLQTAIYQAILAESQDAMRTRAVHSEVIWALNPTNNITEALRRYGVSETSTAVIVVSIDGGLTDVEKKMGAVVAGTLSSFDELENVTDWTAVKKVMKKVLGNEMMLIIAQYNKLSDMKRSEVDRIVVSTVAMKSVVS